MKLPALTNIRRTESIEEWYPGARIGFPLPLTDPTSQARNEFWVGNVAPRMLESIVNSITDVVEFAPFDDVTAVLPMPIQNAEKTRILTPENPEGYSRHGELSINTIKGMKDRDERFGGVIAFINQYGYPTGFYLVERNLLIFQRYAHMGIRTFAASTEGALTPRMKLLSSFITYFQHGAVSEKFSLDNMGIGTDIEFSVFDSKGTFFPATCFVNDSLDNVVGTDGNVETLEIRPRAAKSPEQLTDNVEKILRQLMEKIPQGHDFLGGGGKSLRRSTGLHIHFSGTKADSNLRLITPDVYVLWLDELLGKPLLKLRGAARGDEHYGNPGDYRNKLNHSEFCHNGWEWRVPPTCCITKPLTRGIFALAWCIVRTATLAEKEYEFDETDFSVRWYKNLVDYDKYAEDIGEVVKFVAGNGRLDVPILHSWFGRSFEKDFECDIDVLFANQGGLEISPFKIYHPQKRFRSVYVYECEREKMVYLYCTSPENIPESVREFIEERSEVAVRIQKTAPFPDGAYKKPVLYLGLSRLLIHELSRKNHGSRNYVKMFVQDIIKNM